MIPKTKKLGENVIECTLFVNNVIVILAVKNTELCHSVYLIYTQFNFIVYFSYRKNKSY